MGRLPRVVGCGIRVVSEPIGVGDGNSFACGVTRKGDAGHCSKDGAMMRAECVLGVL